MVVKDLFIPSSRIQFRNSFLLLFIFALGMSSCSEDKLETESEEEYSFQVFTLLDSSETGINFVNELHERPDWNILFFDYFYNGGGVTVGDINNDGLPDLFFTGNTSGNRLYLNLGDMKFKDITEEAGIQNRRWSHGAVMLDINNNGLLDIYVCNGGPYTDLDSLKNELYINQGDGTFIEAAAEFGIDGAHRSTHASFFDYNQNGLMDLFVLNYSDLVFRIHDLDKVAMEYPREKWPLNSSTLYRNNGDGTFTDVTEEAGILHPSFGLGVITSDMTGNGLIDIYISNDYMVPNFLFVNQGDGTFVDQINNRLGHCSHFSMGVDFGDINNDGLPDIVEVDMMPEDHVLNKIYMRPMNAGLFFQAVEEWGLLPQFMFNSLHIQHGFGTYSNIAQMAGVAKTDWSWSALLADVNNNGWKDYLVTNGFRRNLSNNDYILEDFPQVNRWMVNEQYDSAFAFLQDYPGYPLVNYLYQNNGDLTFTNRASDWGIGQSSYSYGAVFVDLDLDGDLDLVINNLDDVAFVYRNNTSEKTDNKWIQFQLTDTVVHRTPMNSSVEIVLKDGKILKEEIRPTRGYQSATSPIMHFGLGPNPQIEEFRIFWSNNLVSVFNELELNQLHIFENNGTEKEYNRFLPSLDYRVLDVSSTLFREPFFHKEDDYHDFQTEILLPYRQSRLGPKIGYGDVDGSGFYDFFIGGAKGQSGALYLLDPQRGFYKAPCQPWEDQYLSEDMGSVFFDANGNGLLDLYVVSGGGGEFQADSEMLRDRLYINEGNGCFSGPIEGALPDIRSSGGRVIAGDFDGDGKIDLFVAGRTYPGVYPFPAESVLLKNEGGTFRDVTDEWIPDIRHLGMITDAVFHDFNGNGKLDLMVSVKWQNIKLYINEGGRFVDRSKEWGLADKTGWWYSLQLVDLNGNGKKDVIAGNLGLNNKWGISEKKPLHVFAHDFDDNGTIDIVLSSKYRGRLVPLRGRECSSEQMPFILDRFPTYSEFANASLMEVYGEDKLEDALTYTANESRSMVLMNKGKKFEFIPLPRPAQIGPIMATIVLDANEDGIPDIIIGGGIADTEPETPAFDGNRGMLLIGNGDGTFEPQWLHQTGLYFNSRNVKDLALLPAGNFPGHIIIAANNNDPLQAIHFIEKR